MVIPELRDDDPNGKVDRLYQAFLGRFGLDRVSCAACVRARLPAPFNLESYSYTARGGPTWTWDVGYARAVVSHRQPRAQMEQLEPDELAAWLEHHCQVDEQHLAHIPPEHLDEPVLLAPAPDGQGQA